MTEGETTIIAQRDGVILRQAREDDLPRVDEIISVCYTPIHDSYVDIVGEDIYRGIRRSPDQDWRIEKTDRIKKTYHEHPDCMWVLEDASMVFGFVFFGVFPKQNRLWIEENGLIPEKRGQGWGTFMLRHVLNHARRLGIRFASVEVDLDDVHIPDLERRNPGSTLNTEEEGVAQYPGRGEAEDRVPHL